MNKLVELRVSKGLTIRQLAQVSGVSPTTITRLEGNVLRSHPVTVGKLARALNVSLTELADFMTLPKENRAKPEPALDLKSRLTVEAS